MGPDPLANVVGQLHISRTQYFMRCHKSITYSEPDVRSILALSLTCVDVNAHVDMRRVMQGLAAHHAALLTPTQFTIDVSDDPVRVRTCIALMTLGELGEFGGPYTPAIAEMIHNLDNDLSDDLMAVGRSAVRAISNLGEHAAPYLRTALVPLLHPFEPVAYECDVHCCCCYGMHRNSAPCTPASATRRSGLRPKIY